MFCGALYGWQSFSSPSALRILDHSLCKWRRHLLGCPTGSPSASVLMELGWPDAERLPQCFRSLPQCQGHGPMMPNMCVPQSEHFYLWTSDCLADLLLTWSDVGFDSQVWRPLDTVLQVRFGRGSCRALCNTSSFVRSCGTCVIGQRRSRCGRTTSVTTVLWPHCMRNATSRKEVNRDQTCRTSRGAIALPFAATFLCDQCWKRLLQLRLCQH